MQKFVYVIGVRGSPLAKTIDVCKFAAENMRAEVLNESIEIERDSFGICNRNDQIAVLAVKLVASLRIRCTVNEGERISLFIFIAFYVLMKIDHENKGFEN